MLLSRWRRVNLSLNPISITVVAFTVAWASAPFIGANEKLRTLAAIQNGPGMKTMDRNEKPRIRGRKLVPEASKLARTFQRQYPTKELELLWAALLQCYGSEESALAAVRTNPQMLNPSYSFCNTILESKSALVGLMGEEEALEVMRLNPAVLTCGPSLEMLGAGEVKAFAALRSAGTAIVPEQARPAAVGAFVAVVAFALGFQGTEDPLALQVLQVLKPALGVILGSSFVFTAYAAAKSS